MKILIISDTHGAHRNFDRVIEKEQPLDMLIHLGDVEGDEDYIPAVADCPVHMVRGNNDFFSGLPGEEEFMIGGYHIFITHGHGYYVSMGEDTSYDIKNQALLDRLDGVPDEKRTARFVCAIAAAMPDG